MGSIFHMLWPRYGRTASAATRLRETVTFYNNVCVYDNIQNDIHTAPTCGHSVDIRIEIKQVLVTTITCNYT